MGTEMELSRKIQSNREITCSKCQSCAFVGPSVFQTHGFGGILSCSFVGLYLWQAHETKLCRGYPGASDFGRQLRHRPSAEAHNLNSKVGWHEQSWSASKVPRSTRMTHFVALYAHNSNSAITRSQISPSLSPSTSTMNNNGAQPTPLSSQWRLPW